MDSLERKRQVQDLDRQIGGLGSEIMRMHDAGTDLDRIDAEVDFLETLLRRRRGIRLEMKREQKRGYVDLDALSRR